MDFKKLILEELEKQQLEEIVQNFSQYFKQNPNIWEKIRPCKTVKDYEKAGFNFTEEEREALKLYKKRQKIIRSVKKFYSPLSQIDINKKIEELNQRLGINVKDIPTSKKYKVEDYLRDNNISLTPEEINLIRLEITRKKRNEINKRFRAKPENKIQKIVPFPKLGKDMFQDEYDDIIQRLFKRPDRDALLQPIGKRFKLGEVLKRQGINLTDRELIALRIYRFMEFYRQKKKISDDVISS